MNQNPMNLFGKLLKVGGIVLLMTACGGTQNAASSTSEQNTETATATLQEVPAEVSVTELNGILADVSQDVVLLDVRTPGEVADGFIKGAIMIDYRSTDFESQLKGLDAEKHYYVYCASGGRSGRTQGMMEGLGFAKVTNVAGGMSGWKAAGFPVEMP